MLPIPLGMKSLKIGFEDEFQDTVTVSCVTSVNDADGALNSPPINLNFPATRRTNMHEFIEKFNLDINLFIFILSN